MSFNLVAYSNTLGLPGSYKKSSCPGASDCLNQNLWGGSQVSVLSKTTPKNSNVHPRLKTTQKGKTWRKGSMWKATHWRSVSFWPVDLIAEWMMVGWGEGRQSSPRGLGLRPRLESLSKLPLSEHVGRAWLQTYTYPSAGSVPSLPWLGGFLSLRLFPPLQPQAFLQTPPPASCGGFHRGARCPPWKPQSM